MDQLEEIKSKINIVDLIGEHLVLKKAGRNYKGLCPFHGEKTPSFVVSPERQIWHCFGCGAGGDVFTFLMESEHMDFPEALRILAEKAGVTLTTRPHETEGDKLKQRLLEINHLASEFYHYLLTRHSLGEKARRYLKERGVKDQSVETFFLGYAPDNWDNLSTFLSKKGYSGRELETAGLVVSGKRGYYDRFRGRVMFTLRDHRGNVIGFSGRVLNPKAKDAKYINSPETPLYIKGNTLYGLEVTKDALRKENRAVVVEGEFDVISSFQAGVGNVVAIKGSAFTEAQVNLLKRFCEQVVLALDSDIAGDAAARRGIELADNAGLSVYVATIPSGKDPDEASRENPGLWKKAIKSAVAFYDFLLSSAVERHDVTSAFGKKKITDELLPIIAKIQNPIIQAHYTKTLAERLNLREEHVSDALKKVELRTNFSKSSIIEKVQIAPGERLQEYILSLIIQSHEVPLSLAHAITIVPLEEFTHLPVRSILEKLSTFLSHTSIFSSSDFVSTLPAELIPTFDRAYLYDMTTLLKEHSVYDKELDNALLQLKKNILRRKLAVLSTKLKQRASDNESELVVLNRELTQIRTALKDIGER